MIPTALFHKFSNLNFINVTYVTGCSGKPNKLRYIYPILYSTWDVAFRVDPFQKGLVLQWSKQEITKKVYPL